MGFPIGHGTVRIVGDNLGIIRHCAGQARYQSPDVNHVLAESLGDFILSGIAAEWVAVRRQYNRAADAVATSGILWARANQWPDGSVHTRTIWQAPGPGALSALP